LQINFTHKAPQNVTQIADLSGVSARFVIRHNAFSYNRARGILLQSSFGLVENNTFTGQTAQGIVVGAASGSEGQESKTLSFAAIIVRMSAAFQRRLFHQIHTWAMGPCLWRYKAQMAT
jgi:parallel beta-helix repeat protein